MAIRATFADDRTGLTVANAHWVLADPVLVAEGKRVVLKATVWASAAAKVAGKAPLAVVERPFEDDADYDALRAANLDVIEPALIARYFTGGTRVQD